MSNFLEHTIFAHWLPDEASVRSMRLRKDHVIFLPYSPRGWKSGLWLERNPNHPRIWGWLAGVPEVVYRENLRIIPGAQVIVARCKGERIAQETPPVVRYPGHKWDMIALPVEDLQLVIDPPLVRATSA